MVAFFKARYMYMNGVIIFLKPFSDQ